MPKPQSALVRLVAQEKIQPRFWLALRASAAFMVPLLAASAGFMSPFAAVIASFSAHSVTMQDVRGHYGWRLRILAIQGLVVMGAVALGALAGHHVYYAILGAVIIAMGVGFLRHALPEYGPGIAAASAMLFFTTLSAPYPLSFTASSWLLGASLLGSLWGILLVVIAWPIAPQQPFRGALAESWQALANFCDAVAARPLSEFTHKHEQMAARELALNQALARTQKVLDGAGDPQQSPWLPIFLFFNRRAGVIASELAVLDRLLATEKADANIEEAFHALLHGLSNTAKSVALALVFRRKNYTVRTTLRLARASRLLKVLRARLESHLDAPVAKAHALDLLSTLDRSLQDLSPLLQAALGEKEPEAMPTLELEDLHLPASHPLERACNLNHGMGRDLLRFSFRLAAATAIGVAIFKYFRLPHGFWIPFSTLVVLQPDFGSTRKRAFQRTIGTLLGGLAVSALVWLQLPPWAVLTLTALLCGTFTYYVRRHYGAGIFLLTMLVILQLEITGPTHLGIALERMVCCLIGSLLALLAAWRLWPVWEEQRIRPLLAGAIRTTAAYFASLLKAIQQGEPHPSRQLLRIKLQAELAHGRAFAGLGRMAQEPAEYRTHLETLLVIANGSLRLTHILNSIMPHVGRKEALALEGNLQELGEQIAQQLELLARQLETCSAPQSPCPPLAEWHQLDPQNGDGDGWLLARLRAANVELDSLRLAIAEGQALALTGTPEATLSCS